MLFMHLTCRSDFICVSLNHEFLFTVTKNLSQTMLSNLKWMLQKDNLEQDMFLIGRPGCQRRQLAMAYSQLTQKEVEFVSLSRDTTEADLKQRREINNGCATYFNQVCVLRLKDHFRWSSDGLRFEEPLDTFSRALQIFPKSRRGFCAIFLYSYSTFPYRFSYKFFQKLPWKVHKVSINFFFYVCAKYFLYFCKVTGLFLIFFLVSLK